MIGAHTLSFGSRLSLVHSNSAEKRRSACIQAEQHIPPKRESSPDGEKASSSGAIREREKGKESV